MGREFMKLVDDGLEYRDLQFIFEAYHLPRHAQSGADGDICRMEQRMIRVVEKWTKKRHEGSIYFTKDQDQECR